MKCAFCSKEAFVELKRFRIRLCEEHYISFINKRVLSTKMPKNTIMAISGGKDSLVMGYILKNTIKDVLFLDLGINNFSKKSLKTVESFCSNYDLNLHVVDLKSEGIDLGEMSRKKICSVCGLVKRYYYNKYAYENNFKFVATGHTLDDLLVAAFTSMLAGDVSQFTRIKPQLSPKPKLKLVGRIKPLYKLYDNETELYAEITRLKPVKTECPYKQGASSILYKKWFNVLEEKKPNIKYQLYLSWLKNFIPFLRTKKLSLHPCKICGYPTTGEVCSFCKIFKKTP